ncbi:MAG: hypothetical protein HY268_00140 [Deltaproteobacteria bacterium]|nr:hypothetical protein [Deltaproteobacteria bacterium]
MPTLTAFVPGAFSFSVPGSGGHVNKRVIKSEVAICSGVMVVYFSSGYARIPSSLHADGSIGVTLEEFELGLAQQRLEFVLCALQLVDPYPHV